jgi:hypothetical protein
MIGAPLAPNATGAGVGDQWDDGGLERLHPGDQHCGSYRHGCAEARQGLEQGPKAASDEDGQNPTVPRDRADSLSMYLALPGVATVSR